MRILHVLEATGHGTGRHLYDLVRFTPDVDHVVVLPRDADADDRTSTGVRLSAAGATVRYAPMRRRVVALGNLRALVRILVVVLRTRPDVIHGHAAIGGVLARLAGRLARRPVVYTAHAVGPGAAAQRLERLLGRMTARVVAVSESEALQIAARRLVPVERIVTIPNGIDLDLVREPVGLTLRNRLGLPGGVRLVGAVGRAAEQKGFDVLVAAAPAIAVRRDVHVVLIGDGPRAEDLDAQIAATGMQGRVHRMGHVDGVAARFGELAVLVAPSRWEGGPYVPLEGLQQHVPVVLSDVPGNRDVVVDGESGLLVPVDDPHALALAVGRVLDDPRLADRLVTAGARRLRDRFDVRKMAAATTALYAGVVDEWTARHS